MIITRKLDSTLIGYVTTFENLTHVDVSDTFFDADVLVFLVKSGDAGKAIGRQGAKIKTLSRLLKKRIKVMELSDDVVTFVKRALEPLDVGETILDEEKKTLLLKPVEAQTKAQIIGRNGKRLEGLQAMVKRYFSYTLSVAR